MKLPNAERAVVPSRKLTHYLLSPNHRDGQHKAAFFRRFGFTAEAWSILASALLDHARTHEVAGIEPTPFGRNYVVEGRLPTADGRAPNGAHLDTAPIVEGEPGLRERRERQPAPEENDEQRA